MLGFPVGHYIILRKKSIDDIFPFNNERFVKIFDTRKSWQDDHLLVIEYDYSVALEHDSISLQSMGFRLGNRGSEFRDFCIIDTPNEDSFASESFDVRIGHDSSDHEILFCKLKGTTDTEFESKFDLPF